MAQKMSAREANQRFSHILGRATQGEHIIITRRGEPVAQLVPYSGPSTSTEAWDRLMTTLEAGLPLGGDTWTRDDLYER